MKLKDILMRNPWSLAESRQDAVHVRPVHRILGTDILHGILRMRMWSLLLAIICCAPALAQKQPGILPEFKFLKLDGTSFTKSQIKAQEKNIIIYFDPTCDHCQVEIEKIGKRYNDFKNASFYLISANAKSEVSIFMQTYGKLLKDKKNVTVLLDTKGEFIPKFSPTQYPAIYVYSQGKLAKYFSGTTNVNDILAVK